MSEGGSMKKFKVSLKEAHEKTGLSIYEVAKQLGMSKNTVLRFVEDKPAIVGRLDSAVLILAEFYKVSWKDVVEEVSDEDSSEEGQTKTLLAIPA
jgi:transcriptional regulator with XRE-family HTH domain